MVPDGGSIAIQAPESGPSHRAVRRRIQPRLARVYRLARGVLALGMLLQIILVVTPLTNRLLVWLNVTEPPQPADVILCLGGRDRRVMWAAEYYARGLGEYVVVSNRPGCVDVMREKLVLSGVPEDRILSDDRPGCTGDHPVTIAALPGIDPAGQRFLIVTDREHSRRVAGCFRKAGYTDFIVCAGKTAAGEAPEEARWKWRTRVLALPTVAYEYAALVKYWLDGRL